MRLLEYSFERPMALCISSTQKMPILPLKIVCKYEDPSGEFGKVQGPAEELVGRGRSHK